MKYDPPDLPFTPAEKREMRGVTVELVCRAVIAVFLSAAALELIQIFVFHAPRPYISNGWWGGFMFLQGLTMGQRMQAERARIWLRRSRAVPHSEDRNQK